MLPDYLPGVHPLLVHLPIGLLVAAMIVDLVAVLARHRAACGAATWLLVCGTVLLPLTYWTGRLASDRVVSPFPRAQAVMAEHSDLAWWTLWAFVALVCLRLVLTARQQLQGKPHVLSALLLVGATILLGVTAEHGGQLVFDLGVGVRPVSEAPEGAFDPEPEPDLGALGPTVGADGGFRWRFRPGAEEVLDVFFKAQGGQLPEAIVESREAALVLTKDIPERVLLLVGADVGEASIKARIRRDEFSGTIGLALHVGGSDTLDFLTWDGSTMVLGARRNARDEQLASEPTAGDGGWHEIELVAAGTHFRGYLDGELIVHGHTDAAPVGPAAIMLEGTGKIRLDDIRIIDIDE